MPRPPHREPPAQRPDPAPSAGGVQVWRPPGGAGPIIAVDPGGGAPVASVYLWLRRGAAEEDAAHLGAAHLLEHMLFKGAGEHGAHEAAARIEGMGGDLNAFTSYEQTVLHATVPAGRETAVIELLAEMAFAPRLVPAELAREKGVVIEELRAARDDPEDCLAEELRARAHAGHPYSRPILGTEEAIRGMDADALLSYHRRHYRPDQAVVAVAGPVDPDGVRQAARAALDRFGGRPAAARRPRPAAEPRPGCFCIDGDFEERVIELAWPIPGLSHPDIAALDLAAAALGDGDAGLLRRRLRDELGVAADAWATLETDLDRGLFVVGAAARPGRTADVVEALAATLAELRGAGFPEGALRRGRRGIQLARMSDRETVDGRAYRLAWVLAQLGDVEEEERYEARIRHLRGGEVQAAVATWLDPEAVVAGAICPRSELGVDGMRAALAAARGPGAEAAAASPPAALRGRRARGESEPDAVVVRTLGCGMPVVVQVDPRSELVGLSLVGVGGMIAESAQRAGQAAAWAQVLTRGGGDFDAWELSTRIEARGGALRAWRSRNTLGLEARFPAEELDLGLSLISRILCHPRFDEDMVEQARRDLDQAREALHHDDPGGLAWELAWRGLFGAHPWGRPGLGTAASVARITPGALRAYHRRCITGRNLALAVVGDVDPDEVVGDLDRLLAELRPGAPLPLRPPRLESGFVRRRFRRRAREQHHLVLGFPGRGHGDPDAPAQRLLEGALSGQSGRLFLALREERGLAYSVEAVAVEGLGGGAFFVVMAVDPDRRAEAMAAAWAELARLRDEPLDAAELQRVKARVVDGAVIGLQRALDRARLLVTAERHGPGAHRALDLVTAPRVVDASRLRAVAGRVLRPDRCVVAEVGPDRATLDPLA